MKRLWVRLQLRIEAPKDVKFEMQWHRAALHGNEWLQLATFLVLILDLRAWEHCPKMSADLLDLLINLTASILLCSPHVHVVLQDYSHCILVTNHVM